MPAGPGSLLAYVRPEDRIIEVDARDPVVAGRLAYEGRRRYLALVADDALDQVRARATDLADRFRPISEVPDLRAVSADVLILHGRAVRYLWLPSELREVRIFLVPAGSIEGRLSSWLQLLTRDLLHRGTAELGGRRYWILERRNHRATPRTRVHLSAVRGYAGLFGQLDSMGVRAVVLRWFEDLPHVEPGEDLDLLVADEHVEDVRAVLAEEPGTLPIDLYSVSGLPGSDREGLACYPPELARHILTRAVRHPSGAWVPSPVDHLHSLAYHAVYHKGEKSGLPSRLLGQSDGAVPEHDYGMVLAHIAKELGMEVPDNLEGLDDYLESVGWRPPADTLRRLSTANRWVRRRYFPELRSAGEEPETAVFILRQRALESVSIDEVNRLLDHLGFEVLLSQTLATDAAERCRTRLRGGNWGPGPYPTSGGPPAHVLVTLHYGPQPANSKSRVSYPHLTNLEVLAAKEMLRDLVNSRVDPQHRCNPVHSSDNEEEAWEYVEIAVPEQISRLQASVEERRADYRTPLPVVKVLNRGRRAKVELVEIDGDLAVRKTFGRGYIRHLSRETQAHGVLAGHHGIPPLLASGDTWVLRPYYRDRLQYARRRPTLIPLRILREMVSILRALHEAGYALIDAKPDNFLMDSDGVKLVDFEFLYEFPSDPPPFHRSYTWHAPPPDVLVDRPVGPLSYAHTWIRWTGMPVKVLCYGTPVKQHAYRLRYRASRTIQLTLRIPRRALSSAWKRGRGVRLRGRAAYRSWARSRARSAFGR